MITVALIVAAGRGIRAGGGLPKQYAMLSGGPVLGYSLKAFQDHSEIDWIQVVIHPDDEALFQACGPARLGKVLAPVAGGPSRQSSVRIGLEALKRLSPDCVLIHDAARPFVTASIIGQVISALNTSAGALAGVRVADTLKRAGDDGRNAVTIDRSNVWYAQTPQGFRYTDIMMAHQKAAAAGRDDFTDDAAIAEWAGLNVVMVEGSASNSKLTNSDDLQRANRRDAMNSAAMMEPRTGTGFDVHRFTRGTSVWLCGVEIPHVAKLDGHSDADVGLHALTDAILGALGDGDIGQHFPPSDPKWKGAASRLFLADAARRVADRQGRIANVDITLLCEEPRISPHRPQMQAVIAGVLGIEPVRIGIKATTTEGLGFTGRREGIAAMASALILLPFTT